MNSAYAKDFREVALVQMARFGDLMQSIPLISRIQENNQRVTLFVDKRVVPAAEMIEGIEKVVGVDLVEAAGSISKDWKKSYLNLLLWSQKLNAGKHFDKVYLQNQGALGSSVATLIHGDTRIGPYIRRLLPSPHRYLNAALSNRAFSPLHLSDVWAAYETRESPLECSQRSLKLNSSAKGTPFAKSIVARLINIRNNKCIAINLGAGAAGRRLGWENLAVLVEKLIVRGAEGIVLLGTDEDRETANKVVAFISPVERKKVFDTVGRTKIQDLLPILNQVAVLVSTDTGTLQIAAGANCIPVGIFFGGANPVETGSYKEGAIAFVHRNTLLQKESRSSYCPFDEIEMERFAGFITEVAGNIENFPEGYKNAFKAYAVLVARSTPLGLIYEYVSEHKEIPVGKGRRWHALASACTCWDRRSSSEFLSAIEGVGYDEWDFIRQLVFKPVQRMNDEEKWVALLLKAFPFAVQYANKVIATKGK